MFPSGPAAILVLVSTGDASGNWPSMTGAAEAEEQIASSDARAAATVRAILRESIGDSLGEPPRLSQSLLDFD